MEHEFIDGRLYLRRDAAEREPLVQRLSRVEGQVRGLRQMIEADRYCLDEVQQANAITAAVREVVLLIISQHLTAGIDFAVKSKDQPGAISDMIGVLRAAMRQ
jgi:DNA-binding FrmR family transcriptional regulator